MTHNDFGGQRAFSYFIMGHYFTKYFISNIENVLWKHTCISMLPSPLVTLSTVERYFSMLSVQKALRFTFFSLWEFFPLNC